MLQLKTLTLATAIALCGSAHADSGTDTTSTDAMALAQLVADRPANEGRVGTMQFRLESSRNQVREREALMVHSLLGDTERIAIFFAEPAMIEGTAFLSFNHVDAADENWLFLPVTDRVRRLPVSERGDYFLGTDLTYGDIKDNFKFGLDDWNFATDQSETIDGVAYPVLTGVARTSELGVEMGYASFRAVIDPETAFPVTVLYTDTDGVELKRVEVREVGLVGGVHTALDFNVENLQTGHRTDVSFADMRYVPDLDESVFDPDALAYGIPDVD